MLFVDSWDRLVELISRSVDSACSGSCGDSFSDLTEPELPRVRIDETDSFASASSSDRIKFLDISQNVTVSDTNPIVFVNSFIENHKPHVKNAVSRILNPGLGTPRLAGFVVDTLMSTMMDVASEFGVPSYVFFTSGDGFLSFMFHLQALSDDHGVDPTRFRNDRDSELIVPRFVNPVPVSVLPGIVVDEASTPIMLNHARRIRSQTKGILINTFMELEPHALDFGSKSPPVYPIGSYGPYAVLHRSTSSIFPPNMPIPRKFSPKGS
ncbi:UDP-glucose flavonoid 3-O-glucosyltransferase 6 [Morus notabilis]|uniref:UDP-glucose flavonoid 3-O-glucosyltransferase 6 n=1 Tax=Morus notabilis TaxID=981085 RepID=W9RMW5_9ROSA|nr:UDP-glucose flavonoid 3-O-glucosyltransferase 6 [Morus notabilis]